MVVFRDLRRVLALLGVAVLVGGGTSACSSDSGSEDTSMGGDTAVDEDTGASPDTVDVDSEDAAGDADAEPGDTGSGDGVIGDGGPGDDGDGSDAGDGSDVGVVDVEDVPPNSYPASELLIRITEPGGKGSADTVGSVVRVAGVMFGEAETIVWQYGEQSGAIAPGIFWQSGPINLNPGDNRVTVTASNGDASVSDSIVVTYNPAFRFDTFPEARPSVAWVGTSIDVVFTIASGLYTNGDTNNLRLIRVDASGDQLAEVGIMKDDGKIASSGDEIQEDGVFTLRDRVACDSNTPHYFRATVQVTGNPSYTAISPVITIDCLDHISVSACDSHKSLVDAAGALLDGGSTIDEVITWIGEQPGVQDVGSAASGGYSAWVQFSDGVLGGVLGAPAGNRGAGDDPDPQGFGGAGWAHLAAVGVNGLDIRSKRAVVLAPFSSEFGATDDGVDVASAIVNSECPSYELEGGTLLQGASAGLARFRQLHSYGVASISSHGEVLFGGLDDAAKAAYGWKHLGGQEMLWTGSEVACGQLLQTQKACTINQSSPTGGCPMGTRCLVTEGSASDDGASGSGICLDETQIDMRRGRVVVTNRGYAVTPSFFDAYSGHGFPSSLVNIGACRTMFNGGLASTLYANGARAVTGFSDYVDSGWARTKVVELFDNLGTDGFVGQWFVPGEDPNNGGTQWRLFGALNLNLSNSEVINGDFESGDAVGWTTQGDARVLSKLGAAQPVDGKFMGLISTGLGFTVETGAFEQTFCIPQDKSLMEMYWKFYSEEFTEFCGSQYQDTFEAVLVGAGGQLTIANVKVDDLCGYEEGSCGSCPNPQPCDFDCAGEGGCHRPDDGGVCEGSYNCICGKYFVGLTPSDVSFDQGGVFDILWQRAVKNVETLSGTGPVTLRLYATDTGDSIYDTAILLDAIKFK